MLPIFGSDNAKKQATGRVALVLHCLQLHMSATMPELQGIEPQPRQTSSNLCIACIGDDAALGTHS